MNIDNEELLQRTYALARENNKLLKKMRRHAFFGGIFKILFWVVMLGVPLWMYFTLFQPILQQGMDTLGQVQGMVGQTQSVNGEASATTGQVQGLLDLIPDIDLGMLQQMSN